MAPIPPKYKLTYFTLKGLGECIRFIFAYADVPFEDKRLRRENWPVLKECYLMGKLPVLEVDDQVISQSAAICRFLGKRFGLVADDPMKDALLEAFVDNLKDLTQVIKGMHEKTPEKLKEAQEALEKFMSIYELRASNGCLYSTNKTTWVDIYFTAFVELAAAHLSEDFLVPYPELLGVTERVKSKDSLKRWIKNRPADINTMAR